MTDAELDLLFRNTLPGLEPNEALERRVMHAYGILRAAEPPARRRWPLALGLSVALAAGLLLTLKGPALEQGDPSQMVARGSGDTLPRLGLELAIQEEGRRLRQGEALSAGKTLIFRVSVDQELDYRLYRNGLLLHQGRLAAGDTVLPIGYTLEKGEGPASFRLEAGGNEVVVPIAGVLP